ncbi:MAG: hypothetical protein IPG75_14915 [Gemmatimonadetes bacterium]|nr:hypothetical protein [Gemmatimonadota bacterium]
MARAQQAPAVALELDLSQRYDPARGPGPGREGGVAGGGARRIPAPFTTRDLAARVPGARLDRARRVLAAQLLAAGGCGAAGKGGDEVGGGRE